MINHLRFIDQRLLRSGFQCCVPVMIFGYVTAFKTLQIRENYSTALFLSYIILCRVRHRIQSKVKMILTDFAPEILEVIFLHCDTSILLQVCRAFATTVHATPSLWTSVRIGSRQVFPEAPFYLRYRLERAATLPLDVSFSLKGDRVDTHTLVDICSVLSVHKAQIRKLEISSEFNKYVGPILKDVLHSPSEALPLLEHIVLIFKNMSPRFTEIDPARLLGRAAELYPNLRILHVSAFSYMIPLCANKTPLTQLKTLILDGSDSMPAPMHSICSLLHHTPNLETLWFKSCDRYSYHNIYENQLVPGPWFPNGVPIPVQLPHLLRLAVTTPGSATDFLHYVELPKLRELYLDGTRNGRFTWDDGDAQRLQRGLLALSPRAQNLKRLVLDNTYFSESCWRWLFTGDEHGVSFPELEDLSLCGLNIVNQEMTDGLNLGVLQAYKEEPRLPLRKLSISRSDFGISQTDAIVAIAEAIAKRRGGGSLQVSIGDSVRFTEESSQQLESVGVIVSRLSEKMIHLNGGRSDPMSILWKVLQRN
ncbi:hypothetical protein BDQ17DRAFT_1347512, partial [Cyathus striatus]